MVGVAAALHLGVVARAPRLAARDWRRRRRIGRAERAAAARIGVAGRARDLVLVVAAPAGAARREG
eukprot:4407872-Prymnesium_polylepis.1